MEQGVSFKKVPHVVSSSVGVGPVLLEVMFNELNRVPLTHRGNEVPILPRNLNRHCFIFQRVRVRQREDRPLVLVEPMHPISKGVINRISPNEMFANRRDDPKQQQGQAYNVKLDGAGSFSYRLISVEDFVRATSNAARVLVSRVIYVGRSRVKVQLFINLYVENGDTGTAYG